LHTTSRSPAAGASSQRLRLYPICTPFSAAFTRFVGVAPSHYLRSLAAGPEPAIAAFE